ncbi:MAG: hypothetical protein V4498_06550 [candidate division FCPU426 bacterium]
MALVHYILLASVIGLAVIWPLSFFGYRYYRGLIDSGDQAKH